MRTQLKSSYFWMGFYIKKRKEHNVILCLIIIKSQTLCGWSRDAIYAYLSYYSDLRAFVQISFYTKYRFLSRGFFIYVWDVDF